MLNKKTIIALPLLLILALPLSAFAESFTVTTNKDIYSVEEKAIIVGAIPEGAPDGYAVLIKLTGPAGDCASQNILPAADNSFVSRPVRLDECGFGEFTVSAFYADQRANSTFTISNSSQADGGSKLELRMLKNVILQAQDALNDRVKGLIEGGSVLPEEVAQKYSEGVSEASLALQAIEFGDAAEAKKHMIFALREFREVLDALSEENVASFEQTAEQQAASDDNSDVVGTYNMLQKYYYRLAELAEKNQVDKESDFNAVAHLLANARKMINEDNFEAAALNLARVNALLREIRAELFDAGEKEEKPASYANSTSPEDEELARKLTDFAARYEKKAEILLNETGYSVEAHAKLQEGLSLIASARISIDAQDLESARAALTSAYWIINEAQDLIENKNDDTSSSENSSENDDSSASSETSGKEGDDKDEGNKDPNSLNDDDQ